jgi:anthranilate/para-aminobenzoate synthase component II
MIIWVRVETLPKYEAGNGDFELKRKFEQVSGEPCLVLHMSQATPELVGKLQPQALLLSGCGTWFRDFAVEEFYVFEDLVRAFPEIPTLASCGSHQLLGFMYNRGFRNLKSVEDEPMRRLRPGEAQVGAVSPDNAGYFVEQGFYPIQILAPDPLFAGLPDPFMVRESHTCEIKQLPAEFELIATNENCPVQAMKHRQRPLWATQFHPEAWHDEYPHGKVILQNFFRLAGIVH